MNVQYRGILEINGSLGKVIFYPEDGSPPVLQLEGLTIEIKDGKLVKPIQISQVKTSNPAMSRGSRTPPPETPSEEKS